LAGELPTVIEGKIAVDNDIRAEVILRTLTPLGWHLVGLANLDAAEKLMEPSVKLAFEDPIRSLFAHAWELNLKACLRRQGLSAEEVRKQFGHDLTKLWDAIDRSLFPRLQLRDDLRPFVEHIGFYHRNRLCAYPIRGYRNQHTLTYVRSASARFRIPRADAVESFGIS
jgi:hypothetical protein